MSELPNQEQQKQIAARLNPNKLLASEDVVLKHGEQVSDFYEIASVSYPHIKLEDDKSYPVFLYQTDCLENMIDVMIEAGKIPLKSNSYRCVGEDFLYKGSGGGYIDSDAPKKLLKWLDRAFWEILGERINYSLNDISEFEITA